MKTLKYLVLAIALAFIAASAAFAAAPDVDTSAPAARPAAVSSAPGHDAIAGAEALELAGDYEGACKVLSDAVAAAPKDAAALEALAVAEIYTGKASAAVAHLEAIGGADASAPESLFWLAVASAAAHDDAKAGDCVKRALAAVGDDETALYDLAERFLRAGAPSVSARLYRRIIEVNPKDSMFDLYSRRRLAAYYDLGGRYAEAAEVLASARKAFEYSDIEIATPQEIDYLVGCFTGLAKIAAGSMDEGINILRDAQAQSSSGVVAEGAIVKSLDKAGRTAEADGVYALVMERLDGQVERSSEKPSAWHDRAAFAAGSGRGLARGLEDAVWACRLEPLNADYMDTRAELLSALGRLDEALVWENRAIAMSTAARWSEAGRFDYFIRRRLDILKAKGVGVPDALFQLPEPAPAANVESTRSSP